MIGQAQAIRRRRSTSPDVTLSMQKVGILAKTLIH
jgi:hypothetical protein